MEHKIVEEGAKKGFKIEIKSVPIAGGYGTTSAFGNVDLSQIDLLLVGPQVRHQIREWQQRAEKLGVPIAVVGFQAYGTEDAAEILKTIMDALKLEEK